MSYVGRDDLEQLDGLLGKAIDGQVFDSPNDANHARMTREAVQRVLEDDSLAAVVGFVIVPRAPDALGLLARLEQQAEHIRYTDGFGVPVDRSTIEASSELNLMATIQQLRQVLTSDTRPAEIGRD